jgi:ABC-type glucose/galactose transport system permease subunit|tara:strand:- start:3339 stop:3656 length:318 start_codon:yes stop_codon:yes gene_type:complete
MRSRSLAINTIERKVFWILIIFVVGLVSLYFYLVGASVVNALILEEIEQDIARINSRIGSLESSYIARSTTINEEYALSLGFKRTHNKTFVTRTSALTRSLTLNQ